MFKSIEIHVKFYRAAKIVKFVSKFKLGLPLSWQTLVAPGHDIFLGLLSPFLMDEVDTLIILGLVSLSWHHCRVLGLWLCWPREHLTAVS
jgi:hypothetical protein